MKTWEELDVHVASNVASTYVHSGMLKSHINVLLAKNVIGIQTPVDVIRQRLTARFDIHYDLSDVAAEMEDVKHEDSLLSKYTLQPEDYFEGF